MCQEEVLNCGWCIKTSPANYFSLPKFVNRSPYLINKARIRKKKPRDHFAERIPPDFLTGLLSPKTGSSKGDALLSNYFYAEGFQDAGSNPYPLLTLLPVVLFLQSNYKMRLILGYPSFLTRRSCVYYSS